MKEENDIPLITDEIAGEGEKTGRQFGSMITTNNAQYNAWIHALTYPFKHKAYCTDCVQKYSLLTEDGRKFLSTEPNAFLQVFFPTSLFGLYRGEGEQYDYKQQGYLLLLKDDQARLHFPEYDSVYKDKKVYTAGIISGTIHEVTRKYFAYINSLMFLSHAHHPLSLYLTEGDIHTDFLGYQDHELQLPKVLQFSLPRWVEEARFNAETIDILIMEDYKNLDPHLQELKLRPFMFVVSGRSDNFVPKGFKKWASLPAKYSTKLKDHEVFEAVYDKIMEFVLNKETIIHEKAKFREAGDSLWSCGQGGGLSSTLRITFDTFYYKTFFALSFSYHETVA